MPRLYVNGATLYYETHGTGPALIFAHGLGGNHLSWWQQIPHFRDRYSCVTFAHRGFWPSREPLGAAGPPAFVDDLAALIDHLGFPDVRPVAQTMGGSSCLGYALRQSARVRALVLAATTGTPTHPEIDRVFAAHLADDPSTALFARGIHPAAGERMASEQPARHFLYREIDALATEVDKNAVRAALLRLRTTPPEQVAALALPVLCITGEEDVVLPSAAVEVLASLIPDAQLARVPAAGHSVYFERPALFNGLLDAFLARVDGGGRK